MGLHGVENMLWEQYGVHLSSVAFGPGVSNLLKAVDQNNTAQSSH